MNAFNSQSSDPREQLERAFAFLRRARRFAWVIGATLLVGALAFGIFLLVRTPRYLSETVLLYSEGIRTTEPGSQAPHQPKNTAVRLKEMLLARPLLMRLIQEHGLYGDTVRKQGYVDAVDEFRKDVEFKAPGSDTYTIAYRTDSAEKAQKVTSRLADLLISSDATLRKSQARVTRDFLAGEAKRTEQELKDAELELAKFMAEHPGFAMDTLLLAGAATTGAAIRASVGVRNEAATDPRRAGGVWQAIPMFPGPRSSQAPANEPTYDRAEKARAQAALAAAQTDLTDKLARFTEAHPDVRSAQAAVTRAQERLASFGVPMPTSPANAGSGSGPQVRRVFVPPRAPASTQAKPPHSEDLVQLETQWARLTRNVNESRERHDQLESSLFRADIAASSESGGHAVHVQVIDPAYLPLKPLPPGRSLLAAAFLGVSLLLGLVIAVACSIFDDRIYDGHDAELISPVLAEVPNTSRTRRAHAHA